MNDINARGGLVLSRDAGEGITVVDRRNGDLIQFQIIYISKHRVQVRIVAAREDYTILRDEKAEGLYE
jgi:sRNA-binding carbon storage regulator CsrA